MAIWSPFCLLFKLELVSVEWQWMDLRRVQRFDFFIFHYAKCVQVEWNENNFSCYPASWAQIEQKITNKVERWRRSVDDMNKMPRRLCGCHGAGNDCHRLLAEQSREWGGMVHGACGMGHVQNGSSNWNAAATMGNFHFNFRSLVTSFPLQNYPSPLATFFAHLLHWDLKIYIFFFRLYKTFTCSCVWKGKKLFAITL